jgi:hypothetical protein
MKWLILFVDMHNREILVRQKIVKWTEPESSWMKLNSVK